MKEVKKKKIKIKLIIIYCLSVLFLILCIHIVIEVIVANTNNRPPSILGISVSYVPTASMEPTIKTGDYVMFTSTSFDKVNVDHIIVYYSKDNDIFIIHRVVEKFSDYLITKGDNNPIADQERVLPEMICGRYVTTLGFLSIFQGGINSNIIFFILIVIFVLMIIMQALSAYLKSKSDKLKEEQEKKKELVREELRKQILEEELAKIKEAKLKEEESKEKDPSNS